MENIQLGVIESRFADIIWENEPIASGELSKICEKKLSWKKSTTYTILKRVCERGLFRNDKGVVSSVVTKQEFLSGQSTQFVEETFDGSLPGFVAAFTARQKLSDAEIAELQKIIENSRK